MPHSVRKYLEDILLCIDELGHIVGRVSFETYLEVFIIRRAAEREFTIIAEALSRIAKSSDELHARVDHVRQIASFRNIIVHDYHNVDDLYVWNVIHQSVPILKSQIEAWAAELDSGKQP